MIIQFEALNWFDHTSSHNTDTGILTLIRTNASIVDVAVLKSISAILGTSCIIWIQVAMYLGHSPYDTYLKIQTKKQIGLFATVLRIKSLILRVFLNDFPKDAGSKKENKRSSKNLLARKYIIKKMKALVSIFVANVNVCPRWILTDACGFCSSPRHPAPHPSHPAADAFKWCGTQRRARLMSYEGEISLNHPKQMRSSNQVKAPV